ncbi:hypothetical protein PIB30_000711 [Stylosanthes scabra]|uniref:Uncharacterized protein n=1 Tax=Stylosanthes scabra TaxID=79078 RepID=A0ABU6Z290_9FABA|nr:hypothetical protein [Stylosanthes scabra]
MASGANDDIRKDTEPGGEIAMGENELGHDWEGVDVVSLSVQEVVFGTGLEEGVLAGEVGGDRGDVTPRLSIQDSKGKIPQNLINQLKKKYRRESTTRRHPTDLNSTPAKVT